jgi:hypothetical protein
MPDSHSAEPCAPASPVDVAQTLEDAADLLLIRGVERGGTYGAPGGPRCVVGAISEVAGLKGAGHLDQSTRPIRQAVRSHLAAHGKSANLPDWNDTSADDFEVIDTLRHVAKDIRNEAAG